MLQHMAPRNTCYQLNKHRQITAGKWPLDGQKEETTYGVIGRSETNFTSMARDVTDEVHCCIEKDKGYGWSIAAMKEYSTP